jgi:hypothetical protein
MIEQIDDKDPNTTERFNWNCKPLMIPGDTVASVVSVSFPETDGALALVGMPAISDDGLMVSALLGACTKGRYYTATCRFTTTIGETLELSLRFYCDDQ